MGPTSDTVSSLVLHVVGPSSLSWNITYHTPPEGICIAGEICGPIFFLGEVNEIGGEDEAQKSDIKSCNEFL